MEVRYNKTPAWAWGIIAALVAIAILIVVALVVAGPGTVRETVTPDRTTGQPDDRRQEAREPDMMDDGDMVISERDRVREIVRERPVYVYIERPEDEDSNSPRQVVVVPREGETPSAEYERLNVPATFQIDGRKYIVDTSQSIRLQPDQVVSTNRQVDGQTVYYRRGTDPRTDPLYLRLKADEDIFIRYERDMD